MSDFAARDLSQRCICNLCKPTVKIPTPGGAQWQTCRRRYSYGKTSIPPQQCTELLAAILLFLAGLAQTRERGRVVGIGYILSPNTATGTLLCQARMPSIEACLASMFLGAQISMQRHHRHIITTTLPEDNETLQILT